MTDGPEVVMASAIQLPAVVGLDHVQRVVELERVFAAEAWTIDLVKQVSGGIAWEIRTGLVELGSERARAVAGNQLLIDRRLFLLIVFEIRIVSRAFTAVGVVVADLRFLLEQILALRRFLCPVFQLVLLIAVGFERQVVLNFDLVVVIVTPLSTVDSIEVGHLDVLAVAQLGLNGLLRIAFAWRAVAACGKQGGQRSEGDEARNAGIALVFHAVCLFLVCKVLARKLMVSFKWITAIHLQEFNINL